VPPSDPLPPASADPRTARLAELAAIMERLRDREHGCPWDLKQSLATLVPYLREELDEVAHAAAECDAGRLDPQELREELGDLLFNVVFTAELCRERGWFTIADVVDGAAAKIRRRHPHIFGDLSARTPEEVEAIWKRVKDEERAEKERKRRLRGGDAG
jgi:nucleoside triphosphate diphosphatase